MSRKMLFGVLGAFGILPMSTVCAQETSHFYIGVMGGANFVSYTSDPFPVLNSAPTLIQAHDGKSIDPFWGISSELHLANNEKSFLALEVFLDSKSAPFDMTSYTDTIQARLKASLSYLMINVGYKYNFFDGAITRGLAVQVGVAVGVKVSSFFWNTITMSTYQPFTSGTGIDDANGLRLAVRPELMYDIPLNSFVLTPRIGYDFPITQVDNERNWRASAIFTAILLQYKVDE